MFGVKQIEAATVFGLLGKSIIQNISPFLLNNITHTLVNKKVSFPVIHLDLWRCTIP